MTAHVYWRLNVHATAGSSAVNVAVAEWSLHTTVGGGQAATGGTASADSSFSGDPASNAFDGNASTFWANASGQLGKLQYQFPSAVSIVEHAITARNDTFWNQVPSVWTLECSDDGHAWTIVDSVTDTSWSTAGQTITYAVSNTYTANGNAYGQNIRGPLPANQAGANGPVNVQLGKAPTTGPKTVSGTVKVLGVATGGLIVRAYAKATGELIGSTTSASDGTYSIKCGENWSDVTVVAYDPATYQALVQDQIVPA